ncbi:GspE/PulE family protein, partial [Candidatus Omnitrophota bacterium]
RAKAPGPPKPGPRVPEKPVALRQAASGIPVINMVNAIILKAVEMSASDIHLEPERDSFQCRYRIDGVLYPISVIQQQDQAAVISRIKIMANMDIAEKRLPQDGRVQMKLADKEVDLRISTFPSIYGENLVIRILDRSGGILKLDQLGFSPATLTLFSQLIYRPYGIILVTGPTGSGKTSTLYGALSEINTMEKNIITLEDPVEYEIPRICQSQINVKAGLTFAHGLRSIVRQDPDIIMIGEIRDKETADIAIHAALTGHLVFSTLHTNDAPSAATRLIDMGVEPFLVASSIIGILAQRLMRTLCPSCKKKYQPSPELLKETLGMGPDALALPSNFYKEGSCDDCNQRGYSGRTGIYELLLPNDQIKELISQKASSAILREHAVKNEMKTLRQAGLEKVLAGTTSVSELLRVTEEA